MGASRAGPRRLSLGTESGRRGHCSPGSLRSRRDSLPSPGSSDRPYLRRREQREQPGRCAQHESRRRAQASASARMRASPAACTRRPLWTTRTSVGGPTQTPAFPGGSRRICGSPGRLVVTAGRPGSTRRRAPGDARPGARARADDGPPVEFAAHDEDLGAGYAGRCGGDGPPAARSVTARPSCSCSGRGGRSSVQTRRAPRRERPAQRSWWLFPRAIREKKMSVGPSVA